MVSVEAESVEAAVAAVATDDPAQQDQPSLNPDDLDENGQPKARRRGRRGGRRRRREDGADAEMEAPAQAGEPAEAAPAPGYSGPTPADPFGGQAFEIFDILERAEQGEPVAQDAPRPTSPAITDLEIPPVPAEATAPADILAEAAAPEAPPAEVDQPAAAVEAMPSVEEPVVASIQPEAPAVAEGPAITEPVVGPSVQPVVVSADSVPATERKRGWWRR